MDQTPCEFIADIQKDPSRKIDNLTVRQFYALQDHLKTCSTCNTVVDEIIEKHKDVPSDPNSGWNKIDYN